MSKYIHIYSIKLWYLYLVLELSVKLSKKENKTKVKAKDISVTSDHGQVWLGVKIGVLSFPLITKCIGLPLQKLNFILNCVGFGTRDKVISHQKSVVSVEGKEMDTNFHIFQKMFSSQFQLQKNL